jgi:RNA polymerase sigma-B factor
MEASQNNIPLEDAARYYYQHRDEASLERVIDSASNLIRYYGNLYGKYCDKEDVFQTGIIGLMKALKNYEPDRGVKFITYASHAIIGEIRHFVRKQASYYRPGCIAELQFKVDQVIEEYTKLHDDVPPIAYIAQKLRVKEESIDEVMRAGLISFDEIDTEKIQSSTYESFRLPIEDKLILYQAFSKLSDIQKKVLQLLFYHDMSQKQVAEQMGVNQKKVSRIKETSIQTMRVQMQEHGTEKI